MRGERVGVTGARGVLGQRLVVALERSGFDVICYPADVRDRANLREWVSGCDIVAHLAAVVPVSAVARDPADAIGVNVGGAASVAEACGDTRRLVFVSTSHVYAPNEGELGENAPLAPPTLYGLSKLQAEQWVRVFSPSALIVRVFSYFDARQPIPYLFPSLVSRISFAERGAVLPLRGSGALRDFADAGWISDVMTTLIERKRSGTVNCCTGRGTSVMDLATAIARTIGRADVTFVDDGTNERSALVGDDSKLKEFLGEPRHFDLEAAARRALGDRFAA